MQRNRKSTKLLVLSAYAALVLFIGGCGDTTYISGSATTPPPVTQKTDAALKAMIDGYMATGGAGIPGVIVGILLNGYQPWYYASGSAAINVADNPMADNTQVTAMKSDMSFHIASVTKMFVAQTVIELVKEGKIDVNKTVAFYLPGALTGLNAANANTITISQLLDHTSGIFSYAVTDGGLMYGADTLTNSPMNQFIMERGLVPWAHNYSALAANRVLSFVNTFSPPASINYTVNGVAKSLGNPYGSINPYFAPGNGWHYSNTNYYLLGLIIEKVTGKTVESEIDRLIAKPLGLTDTYLPAAKSPSGSWFASANRVRGYTDYFNSAAYRNYTTYTNTKAQDDLLKFTCDPITGACANGDAQLEEDYTEMDPSFAWTSGSMISSAKDLIRMLQYINATRIQTNQELPLWIMGSALPGTETFKYARGLVRITLPDGGGTAFGHGGQFAGYNVAAFWYADLDVYMVVMTNKYTYFEDDPNAVVGQIAGGAATLYKISDTKQAGSKGDPNTAIINGILGVLQQDKGVADTTNGAGLTATPKFPDVTRYMR